MADQKEEATDAEKRVDQGPGRGYFGVNKINKQPNGGLHIDFTAVYPNPNGGEEAFISESDKKTSERVPVDLFLTTINSLNVYVAKICNYTNIKSLSTDKKFKATKEQEKFISGLHSEYLRKIKINGLQMWSNGEFITGCLINYSLEGINTQSMDHKTYKIDLSEDINIHGFEDELRDVCTKIVHMSYDYIFHRVGQQMQEMPEK